LFFLTLLLTAMALFHRSVCVGQAICVFFLWVVGVFEPTPGTIFRVNSFPIYGVLIFVLRGFGLAFSCCIVLVLALVTFVYRVLLFNKFL